MKANSKHYFLVIFGILTLVIVIFGYWFVYKVVIGQMQANSYAIEKLSIGQDSIKQQQKLLETEENTTEKRAKLLSYLTSDEKVLDFIKAVESIAGQTSTEVVLSAISPSGNTNKASSTISYIKIRANIRVGLKKLSTLTLGFHPTVPNFAQRINISEGTGGRPQEILNIMG